LLAGIESLSEQIREYHERIELLAQQSYPQVAQLKQVKGVGTLIALTFLLTLEDAHRFRKSRDVGCYLGLQPGRRNSGQSEPQMHISKEGDPYLRTLLVHFFDVVIRSGSGLLGIFQGRRVAPQECNGEHQNEHQQPEQAELYHRGPENTGSVARPASFLRKRGHFQTDYQDAPNRSDQANHQERFGYEDMRANRNAHRVQNLHQHQHDEQLVQYAQSLSGNRPVPEAIPQHISRGRNRREGGNR